MSNKGNYGIPVPPNKPVSILPAEWRTSRTFTGAGAFSFTVPQNVFQLYFMAAGGGGGGGGAGSGVSVGAPGGGGGGLTSSMILVSIGALITSTILRPRPLTRA